MGLVGSLVLYYSYGLRYLPQLIGFESSGVGRASVTQPQGGGSRLKLGDKLSLLGLPTESLDPEVDRVWLL